MRDYIPDEEIDRMFDFLSEAGISYYRDRDEDESGFWEDTARYVDMLRAYDGCPITAAQTYRETRKLAYRQSNEVFYEVLKKWETAGDVTLAQQKASEVFYAVMKEGFLNRFFQYRFRVMSQSRKNIRALAPAHYRDYLSDLDVAAYLGYIPPDFEPYRHSG